MEKDARVKVWIATNIPDGYGEDLKILAVFPTAEAADRYREEHMVRVEGLKPWDDVEIQEWEVTAE